LFKSSIRPASQIQEAYERRERDRDTVRGRVSDRETETERARVKYRYSGRDQRGPWKSQDKQTNPTHKDTDTPTHRHTEEKGEDVLIVTLTLERILEHA